MALRRFVRWALVLVAGLILLLATSAFVAETAWFKDRLRRIAVNRAAEVLNGQLEVGQLTGSLWTGFQLHHVVLVQSAGPVLSVDTVLVRYDPRLLLHRHFVLDEVVLNRPVVHITQRADGWNVAQLVKPTSGGGSTAVKLRRVTINDGVVSVEPLDSPARHFGQVQAQLGIDYASSTLNMTVDSLATTDQDTQWRIERATGTYNGNAQRTAAALTLDSSSGHLTVNATSEPKSGGSLIDGTLDVARVDLAPIAARRDLTTDLTGHGRFQMLLPDAGLEAATVSFQVDAPSVTAAGYHVDQVKGQGSYSAGVLHLDGEGAAFHAWASAKGEWRTESSRVSPNTWALAGRFRNLDARNVPASFGVPRLATRAAGAYTLELTPKTWAVTATLEKSSIEGAEIAAGTKVRAQQRSGTPEYEAQGRIANLDPQRLSKPLKIAVLEQPRFHGRVSGSFHVTGRGRTAADQQLTAQATLTDSTLGAAHVPSADIGVTLAGRRLEIAYNGPFEHVTQDLLGVADATPFDLTGTANARVVLHDLDAPLTAYTMDVDGQATLAPSVIAGYDIDQARADATLANGLATVRDFHAEGTDLNATASGTVAFDAEGESNLTYVVDAAKLDEIAKHLDRPIAGAAHVEGKVTGPSNHLTATGTLASRELKYGTTASALSLNGTYQVDVVDQQWRDFTATTKAQSTFLTVAGNDIQQITANATYHANRLDLNSTIEQKDRTLQLAGGLLIHPDHNEVHLQQLAFSTADVTWTLPQGGEAVVQYTPEHVTVKDLALVRGNERLTVDGGIAIGDAKAAADNLTLRAENVQIADLNRILLGKFNVTGTLTGEARMTGTTAAPDVTSKFTVENGSVEGTTFQALTTDVAYRDQRAVIDAALDQSPGAHLTAKGTIPVPYGDNADAAKSASMDVQIESTPIDLGIFQAATSHVTHLTGTGQFNVHVTGTLNTPRFDGSADVANAAFTVDPTGVSYLGGTARLRFTGDRLVIDQFGIRDNDNHTLSAEGGINLTDTRQVQSVDLHVTSDDIHFLHNQLGDIGLDVDLKLNGDLQHLSLTGQASVDRGRVELDRILEQFTKNAYEPEAPNDPSAVKLPSDAGPPASPDAAAPNGATPSPAAPAAAPAANPGSLFDNATIDVKLKMPDNFVIRARDIRTGNTNLGLGATNLTVGGNVDLQKAAGEPISVIGTIQAVRGFYQFQGKRFTVDRDSEVRFRGEQPIDPVLDVSAEQDISGVTTRVHVRGTARQPAIELSSEPPLDQGDILSLIVFGQPVNSLGESQRVNLAERAGTLAAGAIATPLSESIGRALDLDVFEIRAAGESGGGPTVTLGHQVGRLFIGVRQEFGREEVSAVSFEYRLSSLLRLVTSVAQGATQTHQTRRNDLTGMDLIFVIRY